MLSAARGLAEVVQATVRPRRRDRVLAALAIIGAALVVLALGLWEQPVGGPLDGHGYGGVMLASFAAAATALGGSWSAS